MYHKRTDYPKIGNGGDAIHTMIYIAIIPPKQAIEAIRSAMGHYTSHMKNVADESTWHMPLVIVPTAPPTAPLRQSFHQTVRILSIGEGEKSGSLSVRVQQSPGLTALQASFSKEATLCIPQIYLGSFETVPPFGILDTPLAFTLSIRELNILQTDPYEILGTIPITS